MKKGFKVFCWVVLGFLAFCALIATFSDDDSSTSPTPTEQKQENEQQAREQEQEANQAREQKEVEQTEAKQEAKNEDSIFGTYEVTDKVGCTIHITINEDETATITGVKGEDVTYYCSWNDWRKTGYGIGITFSDERPYLVFDGGDNTSKYPRIHLKDGWLYTSDAVKSNNPKWRLKATKIN